MPKLARQDYQDYYSYSNINENNVRYLREKQRTHVSQKRRRNPIQILICLSLVLFFALKVMPFCFNNITKSIFIPTPYKNIKTNVEDIIFPTHKYLSNSWFLGQRDFRISFEGKKAQMISVKENVNMPLLQSELSDLAKLYPAISPSVYVWDYETQNYVDIDASKIYSAASIIKIPVLIDLFKSIEAGQISLEDEIPLTEYFRTEGSGHLQFRARDSKYSVDELARRMITDSDNSATNMLMAKIGSMTDVNQALRTWGLKNTQIRTWLPDLGGTNYTTARDIAQMLYNVDENNKFLSESSKNKIFDYMGHVHNNRLIHAGLGEGAVFFHKTGDIGTMLGDAGIVIAPNGKKYIVVILANRPHNDPAGKDFIVAASDIIYKYMVK